MLRGPLECHRSFRYWLGDWFCIPTRRLPEFRLLGRYRGRFRISPRPWRSPSFTRRSERRGRPARLIRTTVPTRSAGHLARIVTPHAKPIRSTATGSARPITALLGPRSVGRTPVRRVLLTRPSPTPWPEATRRSPCGERSAVAAYRLIWPVPVGDIATHWSTPVNPLPRVRRGTTPRTLIAHAE